MKKILIFAFGLTVMFNACKNKPIDSFSLNINIKGDNEDEVLLQKYEDGRFTTVDSTKLKNGICTFNGKSPVPMMYRLKFIDKNASMRLFIENSQININADIDSLDVASVKGSISNDTYKDFFKLIAETDLKMEEIDNSYVEAQKNGDKVVIDKLDSMYQVISNEQKKIITDYVMKNNKSVVSAYITIKNLSYQMELNELEPIVNNFDSIIQQSNYVTFLRNKIEILKNLQIGKPAPDFTMNDTTGKPVSLSSFKGKFVLIDFWASWCSSCRAENPNVVAAFNQFKKKPFTILGVSFDKKKEYWLKAIKDDKLTWNHVSDLKEWDNAAGKIYGINSIPQSYLIDKNGIIIAKNLRGNALINKLKEVLK